MYNVFLFIFFQDHRDKHINSSHDLKEMGVEERRECDECDGFFYNERALDYHKTSVHKRYFEKLRIVKDTAILQYKTEKSLFFLNLTERNRSIEF